MPGRLVLQNGLVRGVELLVGACVYVRVSERRTIITVRLIRCAEVYGVHTDMHAHTFTPEDLIATVKLTI